jgi:hypothetical protein
MAVYESHSRNLAFQLHVLEILRVFDPLRSFGHGQLLLRMS